MLALVDREGPSGVAREMMPKLLGKTTRETNPGDRGERAPADQAAVAGRGPQRDSAHDASPGLDAAAAQVPVPTLVITGDEDELIPVDESRSMAAAIPGATLVIIPGRASGEPRAARRIQRRPERISHQAVRHESRRDIAGPPVRCGAIRAQDPAPPVVDPLHRPFDEILDIYVRDGLVYYRALKEERGKFDRYVQALGETGAETLKGWTPDRQLAFWINAYNAFVLRTVIDRYPIRGSAPEYPANSIRQIPGAFERGTFRAGGRMLTLDAIEKDVIGGFGDPRALLALGRGAIGGRRLKSEAYTSDRLDAQLTTMTSELVTSRELVFVDAANDRLSVNPCSRGAKPSSRRWPTGRRPSTPRAARSSARCWR